MNTMNIGNRRDNIVKKNAGKDEDDREDDK